MSDLDLVLPVSLASPRTAASVLKRAIDLLLAAVLLVASSPVLLLAMALVRLTSRGPALFVQKRIGHRCREFSMVKLRTMVDGADELEDDLARRMPDRTFLKLADDPRRTRLGRWMRRASLDELPQLYNVLRGDMSLVGPRPLLPCDFRKFPRTAQMRRFAVKPGITGLWQVSGRSRLADDKRMELDLEYVDRWGLRLDLGILLRTLPAVVRGDGAV